MSVLQNAVLVIQVPTFLQSTNNNNPKISTLKMIEVSDKMFAVNRKYLTYGC
jgi:hypothetical protein